MRKRDADEPTVEVPWEDVQERIAFAALWAEYQAILEQHAVMYALPEYPEWLSQRAIDKR